jgi:hypothetical protein
MACCRVNFTFTFYFNCLGKEMTVLSTMHDSVKKTLDLISVYYLLISIEVDCNFSLYLIK